MAFSGRFFSRVEVDEPVAQMATAVAVAEAPKTPEPVAKPERHEHDPINIPPDEYVALAERLGVHVDGMQLVQTARVLEELKSMGLSPYRNNEVFAYLTSIYGPGKNQDATTSTRRGDDRPQASWRWKPLRESDVDRNDDDDFGSRDGSIAYYMRYSKPVPYPVLLTVERLANKFPDMKFFVSDEAPRNRPVSDPFLMVWTGERLFVIEQWDEPSFTGKRE